MEKCEVMLGEGVRPVTCWTRPGNCLNGGRKDGRRFRKPLTSLALSWIWKHGRMSRLCAFRRDDDKLNSIYLESKRSEGHPKAVGAQGRGLGQTE